MNLDGSRGEDIAYNARREDGKSYPRLESNALLWWMRYYNYRCDI